MNIYVFHIVTKGTYVSSLFHKEFACLIWQHFTLIPFLMLPQRWICVPYELATLTLALSKKMCKPLQYGAISLLSLFLFHPHRFIPLPARWSMQLDFQLPIL